ncbi:MAG: phosphate acyltransferase PlsX [Clostridia bacterium]|nr:phosphate acyltransferase PlsX [Clostridia bacterium]
MKKILVDALGADLGPEMVVDATILALERNPEMEIELVGQESVIKELLNNKSYQNDRLTVTNATEEISCDESPVDAIRNKKNSSLVICFDKLKTGEYAGLVSAGSSGAILSGAVLKVGRVLGLSRPAFGPIIPTVNGGLVMLIDSGANVDCKPVNLCHFALIGSEYMKAICKIDSPRVALLNIGTESAKGNELVKETYPKLEKLPINFVGNMEARDFLSGNVDVVVCDGFSGNILLKGVEGSITNLMKCMKAELMSSFSGKIGGFFAKKPLKNMMKKYNWQNYGGSVVLGCKQIVVKAHGASSVQSFMLSIEQVKTYTENNLIEKISKVISENKIEEE